MTYNVFLETELENDENDPNENTIDDSLDDISDASMNEAESFG